MYEQDYYFQNIGLFERREEYVNSHDLEAKQNQALLYFYRQICQGYAITGHWNEQLIDASTNISDDEYLLYGVNIDEEKLYVLSIDHDVPHSYVVSAETFFKAGLKGPENLYWYAFVRANTSIDLIIDKEKLLSDYWDFICSTNRKNVFDDGKQYGINYIDAYVERIKQCINIGIRLNFLDAVSMLDHKKATKIRLEYLKDQNMLSSDNFMEKYDPIFIAFQEHISDVLDFNKNLSADKGNEIIEKMKDVKDKELMFAIDLIRDLSKS